MCHEHDFFWKLFIYPMIPLTSHSWCTPSWYILDSFWHCNCQFIPRSACSEWFEPRHDKTNNFVVRPAKTQISLGIRPIWSVFAVRMKKAWVRSYPLSAQRRLWSNWADAQADLRLLWAHTHFVGFVMSRLIFIVSFDVENRYKYEPPHDKTNKMTVRPAKTQISLGIRPVWSESLLCAQWVAKDPMFVHATAKTLIRLGGCPGWSESSLGAHAILLVVPWGGSYSHLKSKVTLVA